MKREVDEKYSNLFHEKIEGMKDESRKLREVLVQKDSQLEDLKDQMKTYAQRLQEKWKEVSPLPAGPSQLLPCLCAPI
jgi:chromosome segregation ATPase